MKVSYVVIFSLVFLFTEAKARLFGSDDEINSQIQKEIQSIKMDGDFLKQAGQFRKVMMKHRKHAFNTTTQNMFGNALQCLFDRRDKDDLRQARVLKSLLTAASRTVLLNPNQQMYVKEKMLPSLLKSPCFTDNGKVQSILKGLDKNKSFTIKNRILFNLARRYGGKTFPEEINSLFVQVLKGTYAMRPLGDEVQLAHLKSMLSEVQDSKFLNEADKKLIKEVYLPQINKNFEMLNLAPKSKDFGVSKDLSTVYYDKNSEKDFDISKNNFLPGPIELSRFS